MFNKALMLDTDFLKNEEGYSVAITDAKSKEYFLNVCSLIQDTFFLKPTMDDIGKFVLWGEMSGTDGEVHKCPISTEKDRIYLFKMAQAKQFKYDVTSGRGSMLRGEDSNFNICPDALDKIKLLGLYQRNLTTM